MKYIKYITRVLLVSALFFGVLFIFNSQKAQAQTLTQEHYRWYQNMDSADLSGIVERVTDFGDAGIFSMAIDATSGVLYAVGKANDLGSLDPYWRIVKRNLADGALVYATTSNPSTSTDDALDIAIDTASGTMYVVGSQVFSGNAGWRIEKRNLSDGSLVYATTTNPSTGNDIARSIAIDSVGDAMYVAGHDEASSSIGQWRIEKRTLSNGALLYATTSNPSGGIDEAYSIAIDTTGGFMYIAGKFSGEFDLWDWRVEKRNLSNGALVYAATSSPDPSDDTLYDIAIDSSAMYLVGVRGGSDWWIEKRNLSDGSLVYSTSSDPSLSEDAARAITLNAASATMHIAGTQNTGDFRNWRIETRNLSNGSLVYATTSNPARADFLYSIVIDPINRHLYAGGDQQAGAVIHWRIEKRRLSDGSNAWGTPLAALDTAATDVASGTVVRLRMNVGVTGTALGTSTQTFKFQFATSTEGPWSDVGQTASTTIWRGFNNPTPPDGSSTAPILIASTTVLETYEETNNSASNTTAIAVGGFGEWDWVIQNNGAVTSTAYNYYFRMVKSDGTALNSYTRYPTISEAVAAAVISGGAFFNTSPTAQNFAVSQSTTTRLVLFFYEVKDREQGQIWVTVFLIVPEGTFDLSLPEFKTGGLSLTFATSVTNVFTLRTAWWDPSVHPDFRNRIIANTVFRLYIHDGSGGITTLEPVPITLNSPTLQQAMAEGLPEPPIIIGVPGIFKGICFNDNLRFGNKRRAVIDLQYILLTREELFKGAPITGFFGPITRRAVSLFQEKYQDEILAPYGLTKGTGFVGPFTRTKLNAQYCTPSI